MPACGYECPREGKFASVSGYVIFCLLYKQNVMDILSISRKFPNVFGRFLSELRSSYGAFLTISEDFRRFRKNYRGWLDISEQSLKMFRSDRNKFRFVQQLNLVNLITHMTSL